MNYRFPPSKINVGMGRILIIICLSPFFVACDGSLSQTERKLLSEGFEFAEECRQSICNQLFWNNDSCAEAYERAYNFSLYLPKDEDRIHNEEFIRSVEDLRSSIEASYTISLEVELGRTIHRINNSCSLHEQYSFDALDNLLSSSQFRP